MHSELWLTSRGIAGLLASAYPTFILRPGWRLAAIFPAGG